MLWLTYLMTEHYALKSNHIFILNADVLSITKTSKQVST